MNTKQQKQVESLIKKASESQDSLIALQFSQAACNVSNALAQLQNINLQHKKYEPAPEKQPFGDFAVIGEGVGGAFESRSDAVNAYCLGNKKLYISIEYAEKMASTIRRVINAADDGNYSVILTPELREELGARLDELK